MTMKPFDGYKSEESRGRKTEPLPAGAYVAQIKAAKVEGREPDETLVLRLDVIEGPYKGYFAKRYKEESSNSSGKYTVKYKGDFKIRVPNDANRKAKYPESDKRNFNDSMWRIERSNENYRWDWDPESLAGLFVGINMQDGEYNGIHFTRIGRLEVADDVRQGIVQLMQPSKPKSDAYEPPVDQQTGFAQVDDEVPF